MCRSRSVCSLSLVYIFVCVCMVFCFVAAVAFRVRQFSTKGTEIEFDSHLHAYAHRTNSDIQFVLNKTCYKPFRHHFFMYIFAHFGARHSAMNSIVKRIAPPESDVFTLWKFSLFRLKSAWVQRTNWKFVSRILSFSRSAIASGLWTVHILCSAFASTR